MINDGVKYYRDKTRDPKVSLSSSVLFHEIVSIKASLKIYIYIAHVYICVCVLPNLPRTKYIPTVCIAVITL